MGIPPVTALPFFLSHPFSIRTTHLMLKDKETKLVEVVISLSQSHLSGEADP